MKHLILLFDGTWNSAATGHYDDITNIFRLNLAISRRDNEGNPQVTSYMPGPGTRGLADEELGGAFGQGIDQIIREAYVNLASNYDPGDKIYLFGFSRGAIAARALSCLIAESGLLKPIRLHLLPTAWKRFVNVNQGRELHSGLRDLSTDVHKDVRIDFLGLFDSVLGRDPSKSNYFSDLVFSNKKISPIVDTGTHLLSMDDNRKPFWPLLWDEYDINKQIIEQIWMPGVHSDIGGIGEPHFLGIASLLTMISRVNDKTSLKFNEVFLREFEQRLAYQDKVCVSDERSSPMWKLFTSCDRHPPPEGKNQMSHELVKTLYKRNIQNR